MYGISPSIAGQKEKEEGTLATYPQQIHLRGKGTICASFSPHIPGAKCFDDFKMASDGMLLSTFKETAIAYGLLESDTEWDNCLSEASISFISKQ